MLTKLIKATVNQAWEKVTSSEELLDIVDEYLQKGDYFRDRGLYGKAIINYEVAGVLTEKYWQGLYTNALLIKEDPDEYQEFKSDVDYVIKNYTATQHHGYALAYNKLAEVYQVKGEIEQAHKYLEKAYGSLIFIINKQLASSIKKDIKEFYNSLKKIDTDSYESQREELKYKMMLFDYYCFTKKQKKANELLKKIENIYADIKNNKNYADLTTHLKNKWLRAAKKKSLQITQES